MREKLRRKIFLISAIVLLVIAVALIVIGYACIGANILEWLTSTYAVWIYVFLGLYFVIFLILEIKDRVSKL